MDNAINRKGRTVPWRMKGAVALEFALIFAVLFGLFYAIISYTIPMIMMQAFHSAAADGARAAVSVILDEEDTGSCPPDYQARVIDTVEDVIGQRIAWLDSLMSNVAESDRIETRWPEECLLQVTVQYPNYVNTPPIPILTLPFIGDIPRLPETLSGSASVRL